MTPRILIGGESFRRLREDGCYYVDKTGILEELLHTPAMVSLITRPRRFGKTLTMSMLREFFDVQKDSKAIFDGLTITKNQTLCDDWMNKYPTIMLSLKQVEGIDFDHALAQLADIIRRVVIEQNYLIGSNCVHESDKIILKRLLSTTDSQTELENSFRTISYALHAHWGKPAIILIDEYDVPLAAAENNGYYKEMVMFIRNLLGAALKTNDSLKFAILTGCLRISKESIFTGLNNFKCFGVSDIEFADKFGFTSTEIDVLLRDAGLVEKKAEMKEWYDGYHFGNAEIYCPWDILQYVDDLQRNPLAKPKLYWINTSGNALVRSFVGRTDLHVGHEFETLLAGGSVKTKIVENLTYDSLHSDADNLWSLLYLTGYLTLAPEQTPNYNVDDEIALVIPNREVKEIFTSSIAKWFTDTVRHSDRTALFDALWNGRAIELSKLLRNQLYATISYYDAHEDYYHAFLTGILSFSAYDVRSNKEAGNGRPDILMLDLLQERAAIIEIKIVKEYADMEAAAKAALMQIEEKKYAEGLPPIVSSVLKYGVSFCKKECLIIKAGE